MNQKTFTLRAVLDLRASAKERAQEALGAAVREAERAAAECVVGEAALATIVDQMASTRFTAASRGQGWGALCRQQEVCRGLRGELEKAEARVVARRAAVLAASIDHKLVDRLKHKWLEGCARAGAQTAERQLEEFVNARRNMNSPSR